MGLRLSRSGIVIELAPITIRARAVRSPRIANTHVGVGLAAFAVVRTLLTFLTCGLGRQVVKRGAVTTIKRVTVRTPPGDTFSAQLFR